jgi:membrane protein DedA with SNARE-associated domain
MGCVNELSDWLLLGLQNYGAWVLGATTLLSAVGLPLPATMLLVAAGALARQGTLDWAAAVALAAAGASLGDAASYWLGRSGSRLLAGRVQTAPAWQRARGAFRRWGGLAIFLSRFALTPLALPVNLIAGSTRYSAWRFIAPVVLGESLWVIAFGGLGYVFVDQWAALSNVISSQAGGLSAYLVALIALVGVVAWRLRSQRPEAR